MKDLLSFLGKEVTVIMDRKMGTSHPKHNFIYPINYGYIPDTVSGDGMEVDAYVLGEFEPLETYKGKVIAIIDRKNDVEQKLVVSNRDYTKEQIYSLVEFQERFFDVEIIKELTKREKYDKEKKYITKENCPFCTKLDKDRIIFETKYWIVMYNANPYFEDEKYGIMTIPKRHIEFTYELTKDEFADYKEIENFMKKFFDGQEYFSFIRQSKSNKSVEHMHYHHLRGIPSPRTIDGENYLKIKNV